MLLRGVLVYHRPLTRSEAASVLAARARRLCSARSNMSTSLTTSPAGTVPVIRTYAGAAPTMLPLRSRPMSECRWILKLPRPYAGFRRAGGFLIGDIVERVPSEGEGVPLLDHPPADVDAFDCADRHHATIAISIAANAADGLASDPLPERL